jgi:large subunit ribosomal protein L6
MSRIGRQPIPVPDNVEVLIDGREVRVKGPNGEVSCTIPLRITTSHEDGEIRVARPSDSAQDRALHGLARTLVANMVRGVTEGYEKRLEIEGVGYRAEAAGAKIKLSLGFSHPVEYDVPDGVEVTTPQPTQIVIKGADKQKVGQVAAELRAFRPAEPYKGKGIKHEGEHIRRKAGKTAV